jgi:hypothetical protein
VRAARRGRLQLTGEFDSDRFHLSLVWQIDHSASVARSVNSQADQFGKQDVLADIERSWEQRQLETLMQEIAQRLRPICARNAGGGARPTR